MNSEVDVEGEVKVIVEVEAGADANELPRKKSKYEKPATGSGSIESKASEPIVEARSLTGDAIFLEDCATVGNIMAKISLQRKRLAAHVVVMDPHGRRMAEYEKVAAPWVQYVIMNEDDAARDPESARRSLRLYAQLGDGAACGQMLATLVGAGEAARALRDITTAKEANWLDAAKTLVHLGVPDCKAFLKAASAGDRDCVKFFLSLKERAQTDGYIEHDMAALSLAAQNGHLEVVEILLSAKAAVDHRRGGPFGTTALESAAEDGHLEVVKMLLSAGASINDQDGHDRTALISASANGHLEVVKTLLSAGADVNHDDDIEGSTALKWAARYGQLDVAKMLLSAGAAVNRQGYRQTYYCRNALISASENGHLEMVQLLLSAGASINDQDGHDRTALMSASENGHLEVVQELLSAGAPVNVWDNHDHTAQHFATENGHLDIVQVLQEASAAKSQ